MTKEAAIKKAKGLNKNVNYCEEWKDAYAFFVKGDESIGGANMPFAIMKKDGTDMNYTAFLDSTDSANPIKEYKI